MAHTVTSTRIRNFYPRPPRGGRPLAACSQLFAFLFLSTPSARRATVPIIRPSLLVPISIHALREEGDPLPLNQISVSIPFLSTPSARRATG